MLPVDLDAGAALRRISQGFPAFSDIAKRNYPVEKIMELIYNPQPKNWPEYATPMAPMPQVPKAEAIKIAGWITGLNSTKP